MYSEKSAVSVKDKNIVFVQAASADAVAVADFASLKAIASVNKAVIEATGNIAFTENITIPEGVEVTISGATGTEKFSGGGTTRHFWVKGTLHLSRLTLTDGYFNVNGARGGRVAISRV